MLDDSLETSLGLLWEALSAQVGPQSSAVLKKSTGLPVGRIYGALRRMADVGLLKTSDAPGDMWESKKELDALGWARAVEIGIPLNSLEKTVGLSAANRKKAEGLASSGQIDKEQRQRRAQKIKKRDAVIRGRAASRAATTDLAQIVQDAQAAARAGHPSNAVLDAIHNEAKKALETLVKALERS